MGQPVIRITAVACALFCFTAVQAADNNDVVITPTAYGAIEAGQITMGWYYPLGAVTPEPISHVWQQRAYGNVGFNALIKDRLRITFIGEGQMVFSTPQVGLEPQTMQTRQFFYVKSAYATCPFGDVKAPFLKLQAGFFPFKYNPDARNLGEYLFRSNAYPLVMYSYFDYPLADIFGIRLNFRLHNLLPDPDDLLDLENDLLLHSELDGVPVQDWSLSDVLSYTVSGVTVSAGGSLCRYLSVYQGVYPTSTTERYYYPQKLPAAEKQNFYIFNKSHTDSVLFDWKSVKVMGRVSCDPKKFIPLNCFGKEDLKIYAETDVIGWKNYPSYYTHRKDRMLTMFGVNLPGFKYIDVANLEFEYCPNNTGFSDGNLYGSNTLGRTSIEPLDSANTFGNYNIKRVPWRWSIYLKKSVFDDHVSFIAQFARDHNKINFYYFRKEYMSFIEALPTNKDWWWSLKTEFKF